MEGQHFKSSAFSLEFYIYPNYQSSAKVGKKDTQGLRKEKCILATFLSRLLEDVLQSNKGINHEIKGLQ